jgi:hypothetical protein
MCGQCAEGSRLFNYLAVGNYGAKLTFPIYKKAVAFAIYIETVVRGFSGYHKYALGTDLHHLSRTVVWLITGANSENDRMATLFKIRENVEELKVCMRKSC